MAFSVYKFDSQANPMIKLISTAPTGSRTSVAIVSDKSFKVSWPDVTARSAATDLVPPAGGNYKQGYFMTSRTAQSVNFKVSKGGASQTLAVDFDGLASPELGAQLKGLNGRVIIQPPDHDDDSAFNVDLTSLGIGLVIGIAIATSLSWLAWSA